MKPGQYKFIFIWIVFMIFASLLHFGTEIPSSTKSRDIIFSEFLQCVSQDQIQAIKIHHDGHSISGIMKDGNLFKSNIIIYGYDFVELMKSHNIKVEISSSDGISQTIFNNIISAIFSMIPFVIIFFLISRAMQSGGKGAMGFGRSKAKMFEDKKDKVTFKDVAGIDEAKDELKEIVQFLQNSKKFIDIGAQIPKGCLLIGPPGTGKTLLARAIAGEAKVPFFSISGSDFVEMFVGVGASRVRDMFEQGRKHAPCIIFIDEIDAVGRNRGIGMGGGNDEREQTLNQMLVEMDGFDDAGKKGVIIIAATNRPDVLDPALTRPGRFDRQISIALPDMQGREEILNVHAKNVKIAQNVDIRSIARGTPGFSGAELKNVINEGALFAALKENKIVTTEDFEHAKDKIMMGTERKSMIMKEKEKKLTAYHEAGHAIVSLYVEGSDPIHKATIIPRGRALGMVMRLPEDDRVSITREKMHADLKVAMGGRAAEQLIFGEDQVTSGASSDIKQATRLAKSMISSWGMNEKIGPVCHDETNEFGHRDIISQDTADIIDQEIKSLIKDALENVINLLREKNDELCKLAEALLQYETLTGNEIRDLILHNKEIVRHKNAQTKEKKESSF